MSSNGIGEPSILIWFLYGKASSLYSKVEAIACFCTLREFLLCDVALDDTRQISPPFSSTLTKCTPSCIIMCLRNIM